MAKIKKNFDAFKIFVFFFALEDFVECKQSERARVREKVRDDLKMSGKKLFEFKKYVRKIF